MAGLGGRLAAHQWMMAASRRHLPLTTAQLMAVADSTTGQ
jgi:hypothetical protein